ncbi:carbohydrate ABC transporter permease [Mesorhizobium hawassense]|uniref:Carbohydrate ABC transporter permease n=1 Tax=Mesorhizobium hawassense TaxID=1209954 RepID=A0A330HNA3_9HYPH|nr:carbohydrate ABC transporter permease [Mesorhizobium hawassense]RAZ89420.1 carbohydrate ABC transporter permease [Mesorhizobium hawassense]
MSMQHDAIRRGSKAALAYALALLATAFFAFPIFWMFTSSLKGDEIITAYPPVWIFAPSLQNYVKLVEDLGIMTMFINSSIIVGLSTCLAMISGTLAAYALARFDIKNKQMIAFEVLSIRMLPPIVSVVPMFILARWLGVFDTYWLLIAAYALAGLPFVVWVMRVFIQDIPQSIEEAALIDGCSRVEAFWRVTLPLLMPGLAATMVIVFMFAWNEFLLASMLTSKAAKTLPVIAANTLNAKSIAWGMASAAGVVMSLPVVVLVLLMQRYLVRGLTLGAVKG